MKNILLPTSAAVLIATVAFAKDTENSNSASPTAITPTNFPGVVVDIANHAGDPVNKAYNVVGELDLAADTSYILDRHLFVVDDGVLDIEEGAVIRSQPATATQAPGNIFVTKDGRIEAQGALDNPIIFTTAMDVSGNRWNGTKAFLDATPHTSPLELSKGLWGALTVCGEAPVNMGTVDTGTPGEGFMEGVPSDYTEMNVANTASAASPSGSYDPRIVYGGHLPNDDSGFIEYVSIRYSGNVESSDNEVQGLTLGGVGFGTKLEYIEIFGSEDDGIEVFGGTASIRNLVIVGQDDDGFDGDHGWIGYAQDVLILNSFGDWNSDHAVELDGDDTGDYYPDGSKGDDDNVVSDGRPFANAHLANFTCIGISVTDGTYPGGQDTAIRFRRGFGGSFKNSIIAEFKDSTENNEGLEIDNTAGGITNYQDSKTPSQGAHINFVTTAGYQTVQSGERANRGELVVAGTTWWNVADNTTTGVAEDSHSSELAIMANSTDWSTGNVVANPYFGKSYGGTLGDKGGVTLADIRAGTFNPVPDPQATAAWGNTVSLGNTFFVERSYRGAFEPVANGTTLWTTGWTALNKAGIIVSSN